MVEFSIPDYCSLNSYRYCPLTPIDLRRLAVGDVLSKALLAAQSEMTQSMPPGVMTLVHLKAYGVRNASACYRLSTPPGAVTPGQSSLRNGEAGKPALLARLPSGLSAQS